MFERFIANLARFIARLFRCSRCVPLLIPGGAPLPFVPGLFFGEGGVDGTPARMGGFGGPLLDFIKNSL
tara:strand:- start:491 stop:697 length:207 start_codon:yes stop_codon:yes gene_type:complete